MLDHLDLGGTVFVGGDDPSDETERWVSITLDGTGIKGHQVIGDYNMLPFKSETFVHIYGGCYFEGSDGAHAHDPWTGDNNVDELYRVAAKSSDVELGSCNCFHFDNIGGYEDNSRNERLLWEDVARAVSGLQRAGFQIVDMTSGEVEVSASVDTTLKPIAETTIWYPRFYARKSARLARAMLSKLQWAANQNSNQNSNQ